VNAGGRGSEGSIRQNKRLKWLWYRALRGSPYGKLGMPNPYCWAQLRNPIWAQLWQTVGIPTLLLQWLPINFLQLPQVIDILLARTEVCSYIRTTTVVDDDPRGVNRMSQPAWQLVQLHMTWSSAWTTPPLRCVMERSMNMPWHN